MSDQESILKLTKKNYTLWRLLIQDHLQKRKIFGLITNEDRSRDRNYLNQSSRQIQRSKRDALDFIFSTLSTEIYEEVKHLSQPIKVWEFLQNKYSQNSIKRCILNY